MAALLTLLVCLSANPVVCETVFPASAHEDGTPMTFFECLGVGGQTAAAQWARENPAYQVRKIQCSVSNNDALARERLKMPEA